MKILMVCLGNICRSPMAEGILSHKARERGLDIKVDSSGTGDYHVGEGPDRRAAAQLEKHGIDITSLRGRQFEEADFDRFDRIYVMDESNHEHVLGMARHEEDHAKVDMILNKVHPGSNMPVPDPYFGAENGFREVHALLDEACDRIIEEFSHVSER